MNDWYLFLGVVVILALAYVATTVWKDGAREDFLAAKKRLRLENFRWWNRSGED